VNGIEGTLLVDGVYLACEDAKFETPRLVYEAREGYIVLGPWGFSIDIVNPERPISGGTHRVTLTHRNKRLTVDNVRFSYDTWRQGGKTHHFGCVTEPMPPPSWETFELPDAPS